MRICVSFILAIIPCNMVAKPLCAVHLHHRHYRGGRGSLQCQEVVHRPYGNARPFYRRVQAPVACAVIKDPRTNLPQTPRDKLFNTVRN